METSARKLEPSICDLCGEAPAEFMRFRYWRSGGMDWPNVCRACDRDDPGGTWKLADWSWGQLVPHGARAEIEEWARERRGERPDPGGGNDQPVARSSRPGERSGRANQPGPRAVPADGRPGEAAPFGPVLRTPAAGAPGRGRVRGVGYAGLVIVVGALFILFADDLRWLVLAPASASVRLLGILATMMVAGSVSGLLMLPLRGRLDRRSWAGMTGVLALATWVAFATWVMFG